MDDFWPEDLLELPGDKTPSPQSIAREQASLLGTKTRNMITAKVSKVRPYSVKLDSAQFQYDFWLEAPALAYTFRVFSFAHDLEYYPAYLFLDPDLLAEVCDKMEIPLKDGGSTLKLTSQESFGVALKTILGSEKVKRIIRALIRQIQDDSGKRIDNDDVPES